MSDIDYRWVPVAVSECARAYMAEMKQAGVKGDLDNATWYLDPVRQTFVFMIKTIRPEPLLRDAWEVAARAAGWARDSELDGYVVFRAGDCGRIYQDYQHCCEGERIIVPALLDRQFCFRPDNCPSVPGHWDDGTGRCGDCGVKL